MKIKVIMETMLQSYIPEAIKQNAAFHYQAGLSPQIVRRTNGRCCKWCRDLAGTYSYPTETEDVYRRHENCTCTVDYHPGNGKAKNARTKEWRDIESSDILEERVASRTLSKGALTDSNDPDGTRREKHAQQYYETIRNSDTELIASKISQNTDIEEADARNAIKHIFIEKHHLEDGTKFFDPDYDMAESFQRLREGNFYEHDKIMLLHEIHEQKLMAGGMPYNEAHALANEMYNYADALERFKAERDL